MPVSCDSWPRPHIYPQCPSLARISMTDGSSEDQENLIQLKTPVRYEWILIRPGSGTCLAPRRVPHLIDLLRAYIVMDTVLQFGALFLAKKRQLAHLKSENRLCAVLAKPGEAASYGAWGKAAKGLSCLAGERRGSRQMDGQGWPMFGPCCGCEFKIRKKSARQNLE